MLAAHTLQGLRAIYRKGFRYHKAGIMLLDLMPRDRWQPTLFHQPDPKAQAIMQTLDKLNRRYGRHTLRLGSMGTKPTWQMKSDQRSPCYTTRWEGLAKVGV